MTESTTPKKPTGTRKRVDWDVVGVHYRAGIRALKDIGNEYGVSDAGIIKHANKVGWTRDLKGKIQAKADAKVSAAMVSAEVSALTKITEQVTIEIEATVQSRIRLAHRGDIGKLRVMVMHMSAELERQNLDPELFKELVLLAAGIEKGQGIADITDEKQKATAKLMMESLRKTLALSSRTTNLRSLVDSFGRLVALEREAYGIKSDEPNTQDEFSSMLYKIANANSSAFKPIQNDPEHE